MARIVHRKDNKNRNQQDQGADQNSVSDHGRQAEQPGDIPKAGWKDIGKRAFGEMKADNIPLIAAGVAFYAWVALIPALIALITIWGLVADPGEVQQQLEDMTSALSEDTAQVITQPIEAAATGGEAGLTVGLVVSLLAVLWSASGGMNGLIQGINVAYDETDERKFFAKRGLALLLTLGAIVFAVVAIGLIAVVPVVLGFVGLGPVADIAISVLRWPLLAVMVMIGLAIVYRLAPDRDNPKMRWVSWGAAVAAGLWLIGSGLFSVYVNNFGSYNETYGALAGVIILNLWLFLSSFIVLMGAELNSEMEAQTGKDTTRGDPQPMGERDAVKADHVAESPST